MTTLKVVRRHVAALLLCGGGAFIASAQTTFYWTAGSDVDTNWTNPSNWINSGGSSVAPPSNGSAVVVFGSTVGGKVNVDSSQDVSTISILGSLGQGTFEFDAPGGQVLTIESSFSIPSNNGYNYSGVYFNPRLTVDIPTYTTFTAQEAGVEFAGLVQGAGVLDLEANGGNGSFYFDTNNTVGSVVVGNNVQVSVGAGTSSALGSGPLTLYNASLTVSNGSATIPNALLVEGNATFSSSYVGAPTFTGSIVVEDGNSLSFAGVTNSKPILILGDVYAGTGTTALAINGDGEPAILFGTVHASGISVTGNGVIIGTSLNALPGTLSADSGSYVGAGFTDTSSVSTFLGRLSPTSFQGTIGFDTLPGGYATTVTAPIDLSGLNTGVSLGSATTGILSGAITLNPTATAYNFGNGGGLLDVLSNLPDGTASTGLNVHSGWSQPLTLVLDGTNTYTGPTNIENSALVYDSPGALSASSSISGWGYVGTSQALDGNENQAANLAAFLGRISTTGYTGVIGLDSTGSGTFSGSLNLTSFPVGTFLGTVSAVTFNGSLLTQDGNYYFTGEKNGVLTVGMPITGATSVTIGATGPNLLGGTLLSQYNVLNGQGATVVLSGTGNTYTGTTSLQSGILLAANATALGNSTVVAESGSYTGLEVASNGMALGNNFQLQSGSTLVLGGNGYAPTLSGSLSSVGGAGSSANLILQGGTLTLSGNNTVAGQIEIYGGTVNAATDTALTNLEVEISDGAVLNFGSLYPTIAGLSDGNASSGSASVTLQSGSTLTLDVPEGYNDGYSGTLTGTNISLIKTGEGFESFGNTNNIAGVSTLLVQQGGFAVTKSGSLGLATVTVDSGALFGVANNVVFTNTVNLQGTPSSPAVLLGFGTYAPTSLALTVGSGAAIGGGALAQDQSAQAPPTGTLSLGSVGNPIALTLASGGKIGFGLQTLAGDLGRAGDGWSLINVNGTTTITATQSNPFVITLFSFDAQGAMNPVANFDATQAYSWTLLQSSGGISGFNASAFTFDTSNFANSLGTGAFSLTENGNELDLDFTPVPEPGTYALMGLGLAVIGWPLWSRRRVRTAASA